MSERTMTVMVYGHHAHAVYRYEHATDCVRSGAELVITRGSEETHWPIENVRSYAITQEAPTR